VRARAFERLGLAVGEIGLGCGTLGESVFYARTEEAAPLLDRAFDGGVTFYDTADAYGYGRSEEILGRVFADRRGEVVIATKVGMLPSSLATVGRRALPILRPIRAALRPLRKALKRASTRRQDFSGAHVVAGVEASLRRLRTDRIDLLQLHSPPADVLLEGEVFEVLRGLVQQGKIRAYGVSADTVADALLCLDDPDLVSLQVPFNVLQPDAARELLPRAASAGIGVIARIPLARGQLTADLSVKTGAVQVERRARRETLSSLAAAVEGSGRTLPQAAIQFVLHHPAVTVAIPGTRSPAHLEEILATSTAPPLSEAELGALQRLAAPPG